MKKSQQDSAALASPAALLKHFGNTARKENGISTLLGLVQVAMTILLAFQVATMLNQAVYQTESHLPSNSDWLILTITLVLRVLAANLQSRVGNRASIKVRDGLRQFALQRCFELNVRLFPAFNAAEASNLLTTEIDKQRGYFADFVAQKNLAVLMPLAIIVASAFYSWLVPLIFIVTAPLVPIFMILVGSRAAEISRVNIQQLNRLGDLLADRLKNLQALQLARTTEQESDRLFEQSEQYRLSTMRVLRLSFLSGTLLEFFSAVSVALVAVYLGLFFLNKYEFGGYSQGYGMFEGVFLLMLAPEFYLPLRKMGALYHDRMDAMSVAEHLLKLDQLHQAEISLENQTPLNEAALNQATQSTAAPLGSLQTLSIINFQSGSRGTPVHSAVTFELHQGQRLLLDGPSGSGKTTLLDTLAGLRPPVGGDVQINQQPVVLFQNHQWFSQIGYMSQRPELLFASIRDNLCLGRSFSDDELFNALARAHIKDTVQQLPGGLDYVISDSGGYLSGGQAQRIALARVFLHKPALLLLDEPTANLDQDTAEHFMASLENYSTGGGMIVMASHRLADQQWFDARVSMWPATASIATDTGNPKVGSDATKGGASC